MALSVCMLYIVAKMAELIRMKLGTWTDQGVFVLVKLRSASVKTAVKGERSSRENGGAVGADLVHLEDGYYCWLQKFLLEYCF